MSRSKVDRVRTFETSEEETLVISAGIDEMNYRTIFSGHLDGRFAVVPVDKIEDEWDRPGYGDDLDVDELEVVGSAARVEPRESSTVTLLQDDDVTVQHAAPGVYAMVRIPFEQK